MPSVNHAPRVRLAVSSDKERYITALRKGLELDPQFPWRYPGRHEYPEDTQEASGALFDKVLTIDSLTVLVAELPVERSKAIGSDDHENDGVANVKANEDAEEWIVVGEAIWEWKTLDEVMKQTRRSLHSLPLTKHNALSSKALTISPAPPSWSPPTSTRRDMNPSRQAAFLSMLSAAECKYFGAEYGDRRLEVASMSVDPLYHRRGAGMALLQWGLDLAKRKKVCITLTASPMGKSLYWKCGFRELGYVSCGIEGEDERVGTTVMVWTPPGWTVTVQ